MWNNSPPQYSINCSKLKLYTDFLSYSMSVTCQSEHVRHLVLARWVERWRRQVSANQHMWQFYPSDLLWCHQIESVLLKNAVHWCQGCESLPSTRDRLSTKNMANDVLKVPAACLHRPAVMTSCSAPLHPAKININNTWASHRTCSRCYVQLDLAVKVPLDVLCSLRIPEKEPSLPALSRAGCQSEQMEERIVSAHSNG